MDQQATLMEQEQLCTANPDLALADALAAVGHAMAIQTGGPDYTGWDANVITMTVGHPDSLLRAALASRASLRQLRQLVKDPRLVVRAACAANPFAMDHDIQMVLVTDQEEDVVHSYLDHHQPGAPAIKLLVVSPFVSVRRRLAEFNLPRHVLRQLSTDPDPGVAMAAEHNLHCRAQIGRRKALLALPR